MISIFPREAPQTPEPNPMPDHSIPNTPTAQRNHGDKAWSESIMLQAEMHTLYKRAKVLEHNAIIAWAKAEVLEMAQASEPSELPDAMIMAGVGELAKDHPSNAALAEAIYLAMVSAKP